MTRAAAAATLSLLAALPAAFAQTSTTHRATATHRSTAATPARVANPADNPPGVPPVTAAPRSLYALRYVDITVGTGPVAQPQKYYTVRYTGWLTDGTKFDSSDDHPGKEPITFPYGAHRVIPGWDTGFQGMRVGGKRRLYIPYQLAYGEAGREGAIPAKADLIFDIELVSFSDSQTPPAAAPAAAQPQTSTPGGSQATDPAASQGTNPATSTPPDSPAPQPSSNPK